MGINAPCGIKKKKRSCRRTKRPQRPVFLHKHRHIYVTESAVSKWERGISYPDITMISGICEVLHISEHELCTASEDRQQREAEFMVRSYKRFVRGYTIITGIGYLAAIIPSFIYNVAHGGIGWFMVLITSLIPSHKAPLQALSVISQVLFFLSE